jgi:hypothetical protein
VTDARARRLALVLLALACAHAAAAAPPARRATAATTSRWWDLACEGPSTAPCVFTVRLRGAINADRLRLLKTALLRRDDALRSTHRPVALRVDVDTHGGEVYSALQIGRILREESATIYVGPRGQCSSACIFVLMGAPDRRIAPGARIGIHRPSLGPGESEATVDAMIPQLVQYAAGMGVPRGIVDEMVLIPTERMRFLSAKELAAYGISVSRPLAAP